MPPNDYYDERSLLSLRREAEEIDECIQLARAREEDLRGAPVEAVERKPKKMKPKKRKQNPGERVTCSVLRVVRELARLDAWKKAVRAAIEKEEDYWGETCWTCGGRHDDDGRAFCDDCVCGICGGAKKYCGGC
jgi:hypothetical protein